MQEAKKSMNEKGIKAEDVKNLPPIEEIHGLNIPSVEETYDLNSLFTGEPPDPDIPTKVVKVNSLYRYDKAEVPPTKIASRCLDEFDNFYNGLTDASRDYLDSCAGSVFRERTSDEAKILLNNMSKMKIIGHLRS